MIGRTLLLGVLLLPVAAGADVSRAAAAGCPCPKQKMVDMFGTISPLSSHGPRKPPAVVTAQELAEARLANGDLPLTLPVAMPASAEIGAATDLTGDHSHTH